VGRHVIRPFGGVAIEVFVFRHKAREKVREIGNYIGVGILLNYQRCGGVLAENGQ
jgi:hypothetical protein